MLLFGQMLTIWVTLMSKAIIFLIIIAAVVVTIIRFIILVKCFWKKGCGNKHCPFRLFCDKYQEITTQEDLDRLTGIIKEYTDKDDK